LYPDPELDPDLKFLTFNLTPIHPAYKKYAILLAFCRIFFPQNWFLRAREREREDDSHREEDGFSANYDCILIAILL